MSEQVRIERGVAVEMRDGVHLATDVYLPEGPGPFPTLVTRIRGARSSGFIVGVLILNPLEAVDRGYAVVVQEVRGRAGSEAAWHPFVHELDDGADCLDWVLAQPWCDGSIGTYGTAYSASTALYLSASGRDEVKALAVLGTGADIHDGWVYTSGAFELGWNVYWAYMTAAETIKRLDVDEDDEEGAAAAVRAGDHRGAGGRRAAADLRSPPARPRRRDAVPRVARPPGLRRLLGVVRRPGADGAAARPDAVDRSGGTTTSSSRTSTSTVLSPIGRRTGSWWGHGSTRATSRPSRRAASGAVEFGPRAVSGVALSTPLLLDWFDRWITGADAGAAGGVRYWQLGEDEWREADAWPPPSSEQRWHLGSGGGANTRDGDGTLAVAAPAGDDPADTFLYDPLDPAPTVGGKTLMPTIMTAGIEDQSAVEDRPDVLCYTSPVLTAPVVVHGEVRVELWASSSAVDTDFTAKLVDVTARRAGLQPRRRDRARPLPRLAAAPVGAARARRADRVLDRPLGSRAHVPARPPDPARDQLEQLPALRPEPEHGQRDRP